MVLRPLIASMATLSLNSGLWLRRLLFGGSPFQERYPASEVNDGACPEKPNHLKPKWLVLAGQVLAGCVFVAMTISVLPALLMMSLVTALLLIPVLRQVRKEAEKS